VCACLLLSGFAGGMVTAFHLYGPESHRSESAPQPLVHSAKFVPLPPPDRNRAADTDDLPAVDVIDVERVRNLAGRRARLRGKVYRVGHSAKSDTYFLDFGPSRSSFTAVIFSSATDAFARENINPRDYEGREVEIVGTIEDDPKYGLEMIVEGPTQIRELK